MVISRYIGGYKAFDGINNYKNIVKFLLHEDTIVISRYIGGYKGFDWINNYKNM